MSRAGLKFLVRICTDLGLKEAADYSIELKKAEKSKEMRDERMKGKPGSEYGLVAGRPSSEETSERRHLYLSLRSFSCL